MATAGAAVIWWAAAGRLGRHLQRHGTAALWPRQNIGGQHSADRAAAPQPSGRPRLLLPGAALWASARAVPFAGRATSRCALHEGEHVGLLDLAARGLDAAEVDPVLRSASPAGEGVGFRGGCQPGRAPGPGTALDAALSSPAPGGTRRLAVCRQASFRRRRSGRWSGRPGRRRLRWAVTCAQDAGGGASMLDRDLVGLDRHQRLAFGTVSPACFPGQERAGLLRQPSAGMMTSFATKASLI